MVEEIDIVQVIDAGGSLMVTTTIVDTQGTTHAFIFDLARWLSHSATKQKVVGLIPGFGHQQVNS